MENRGDGVRLDLPKLADPNCVACYLRNDSEVELSFVSELEKFHPYLIEGKAFKEFKLKPGQQMLVPHVYFEVLPQDVERKITRTGIPSDHPPVEFVYEVRAIEQGNGAGDPPAREPNSDTPLSDAELPN